MPRNLALLLIALILSLGIITLSPSTLNVQIPRAQAASSFTLFGRVLAPAGWGLTSSSVATPGPTLTVVKGDTVTMTLNSGDGVTHNWGIDYNGNGICDAGEPCSGNFGGTFPSPITFTFTATTTTGSYTYYCFIHHAPMLGTFVIKSAFTLVGKLAAGWGTTSTTVTSPGPTLVASPGTQVSMTLSSGDGITHNWGIDYNNNGICDPGEGCSMNFGTTPITDTFTTTATPGNYTYFCFIHFAPMIGTFVVRFPHDVAVNALSTSRNSAYNGLTSNPVHVNVTAQNIGANAETFAVYAKANSTLIGNRTIMLTSGASMIVQFNWTNLGFLSRGNYTLTATATRVTNETIFGNNQIPGGIFVVKLRGDITGDCKVNIFDLTSVGGIFGQTATSPGFNKEADLNNDGFINIFDLSAVGGNFGGTC